MTITTAERLDRFRLRVPRLAPVAAALATLLVAPACRAEWSFTPSIGLRGTFTDNVDLVRKDLARSDLVSEITPAFSLRVDGERLKASATGSLRQYHYLRSDEETGGRARNDSDRQYAAALKGTVVDNLLYVDASAGASQRELSAFGPRAIDNPYSNLNRTEIKTWSVSPYLVHNFGRRLSTLLRYQRDGVESDERNRFGNSTADTVTFNLNNMGAQNKISWALNYQRQNQDNDVAGDSSSENLIANLRYLLNSRLALTASAGYDRYDFDSLGGRTAGRNWSTGFAWNPSQRTSVEASIGRHFYGNTGRLSANLRSRRTVWSINYNDAITTTRAQFTLPSAIDTAALLDSLFSASIADPVQRQQAVAAYMQATGLPPSLAENINFLSNRYMRQKRLQASSVFKWARSSAVLSLYGSRSNALSVQQSDSPLLGTSQLGLNDAVRQRGASALATYTLGPRSSLVANATYSRSESLSTGLEDRQRLLSISANRSIGRHAQVSLQLRRRSGTVLVARQGEYTEHAIAAAITMQL